MSEKASPPWKETMESVLAENMKQGNKDSLNIQLATMPSRSSSSSAPPHPSNRTVVFRGFAGQPRKDDEPTGGNPIKEVQSSLIICSSDRLMLKAEQISSQQKEGVGNGFEVCWWHQGTQEQIRFSGLAWLLTPNQQDNASFPGQRLIDEHIHLPKEAADQWTWEGERLRQFAKHSPGLRASFQNPPPASQLTPEKEEIVKKSMKLPGSVEEAQDEEEKTRVREALDRFCLVVLECHEVDYLKVDPPPSRRQWKLEAGKWSSQDVSP